MHYQQFPLFFTLLINRTGQDTATIDDFTSTGDFDGKKGIAIFEEDEYPNWQTELGGFQVKTAFVLAVSQGSFGG